MQRMLHYRRVVGMSAVPPFRCTDWITAEGKNVDGAPWEINLHTKWCIKKILSNIVHEVYHEKTKSSERLRVQSLDSRK
jgi:hypothetical protein